MTRTRMSAAARREQLLDICRDVVAEEGFAEATIERVARGAGVTRTLIYRQFGDLNGMVSALVERESRIAMDGLLAVAGELSTAADHGSALLDAMMEATDRAPVTWRILLNPPAGGPPDLAEFIEAGTTFARRLVADTLRDQLAETGDPDLAAHVVHHLGNELVRLHLAAPATYPRERVLALHRALLPSRLVAEA